jgi:hypothetical protein
MTHPSIRRPSVAALALATVLAIALVAVTQAGAARRASASGQALVGTFKLTAGSFGTAGASGSYFRMIYPGGTIAKGKFFSNPDSTASDKTYTLVKPGTAGGLVTGSFQASPTPAFDAKGDAKVATIIAPAAFNQIKFGLATLSKDPTTSKSVIAPAITDSNGKLSGQLEALWAEWNNLYFNQGSPKPDGTKPGLTQPVSGTYDVSTGAFVLTWASAISGGPFNGFTGYWHLAGTFVPR